MVLAILSCIGHQRINGEILKKYAGKGNDQRRQVCVSLFLECLCDVWRITNEFVFTREFKEKLGR
jgi:hypothetical protein